MAKISFSTQMIKAFIILSLLSVCTRLIYYISLDTSIITKIAFLFFQIVNSAFSILMLDLICRSKFQFGEVEVEITNFTTWGYVWRGFLSLYLVIPIWILLVKVLPLDLPDSNNYTPLTMLLIEPLILVCITLAIWLFFSKNRLEQIKLGLKTIRGF